MFEHRRTHPYDGPGEAAEADFGGQQPLRDAFQTGEDLGRYAAVDQPAEPAPPADSLPPAESLESALTLGCTSSAAGQSEPNRPLEHGIADRLLQITDLLQQQIQTLQDQLTAARHETHQLRGQADRYISDQLFPQSSEAHQQSLSQLAHLEAELQSARQRIAELEAQNGDLASQVAAKHFRNAGTGHDSAPSLESLSWEERKRMILSRLESEDRASEDDAHSADLQSLRDVVQRTDREIMRRDAEISELRQLLEQQSSTLGGMAVGAAAIAELIDQDELVRQEREKLQEMQRQWEAKLRQAEIDVSLERARLARQRQELEQRNAELEEQLCHQTRENQHAPTEAGKPARRWLTKLGLTEDRAE